ncbi:MAG: transporter substrate-binding domain-containing protein [Saprospiraceae bacterium]|nr:transporter substrate-binding domain-containing protein [Saprospiraceae bacterium]
MMKKINFLLSCLLVLSCPLGAQETPDSLVVPPTLKIGYTSAPPFIIQGRNNLEGINIWLWNRVAKDLDLDFEMVQMSFSDMLKSLESGEIDLSINPLTITSERSKKMDFTRSFFASNSTIAVAEMSSLRKLFQFIRSFFNLDFLKGMLALLFIIFLFGLVAWRFERHRNSANFRKGYAGIWDGFWWSAVTLTTVGYGDKRLKTNKGKITALLLMFVGLLFISGLTASIASSLTINSLGNKAEQFSEFKELRVGSVENSSTAGFLKEHFFKDLQEFSGVTEGLKQLENGKIEAFLYDEPILKHRIKQDSSLQKIEILPVKFDLQFYAFGLAPGRDALQRAISQRILEIIESREWQIILNEFGVAEI